MMKTAVAAAAGHAAASLCFTIRAGQYNVLAASLANNIKPWFWYGCRGIVPNEPYMGDAFDAARVAAFGYGRSQKLAALWATMKTWLRLFDTEDCYQYNVDKLSTCQLEGDEGPSVALKHTLEAAIVDFFNRNATSHAHGDKYLPYQLFEPASEDYRVVACSLLAPLGYALAPEDWRTADELKARIQATAASGSGSAEHSRAIDAFNAWLRRHFVVQRRHRHPSLEQFSLPPERVDEEFHEVALEMATFMALSDADLRRLIAYQHKLEWGVRGPAVAREIERMQVDVLGVEELDRVGFLRTRLAPRLRLAGFKHRKVVPLDDGCAIFYDPEVLALRRVATGPAVAVVRFSGEAEAKGQQPPPQRQSAMPQDEDKASCKSCSSSSSGGASAPPAAAFPPPPPLPLFMTRLRIRAGMIGPEEECDLNAEEEEGEAGRIAQEEEQRHEEEEQVDLWCFAPPNKLRRGQQHHFDERVAVVALLEHKATGRLFLAACTHLAHSQDKPEAEAVRAAQVRQLDRALGEIQGRWGVVDVPIVLMMDGNDTPNLAAYGPHRSSAGGGAHTPMYRALTQELGWTDCLGEDFGPTSITLARRLRIDYIMAKSAPPGATLIKAEATPALDVRLAGVEKDGAKVLVTREEEAARAVYGLPLPAIDDQPVIPSGHLPSSARLTFRSVEPGSAWKVEEQSGEA